MLHTTAGYLLWAAFTHHYTFDYRPGDVYACVADIGWITGHSYIVYGTRPRLPERSWRRRPPTPAQARCATARRP